MAAEAPRRVTKDLNKLLGEPSDVETENKPPESPAPLKTNVAEVASKKKISLKKKKFGGKLKGCESYKSSFFSFFFFFFCFFCFF